MCYHKQSKATAGELEKFYDSVNRFPDYLPRYYENGYDFQASPVLTIERKKELLPVIWGLIPKSVKTVQSAKDIRLKTLNCRSEAMYTTSAFADSAKAGLRCLIPATGFFEWHWDNPTKAKNKTPFIIRAKDQEIFSIGGIYTHWFNPDLSQEQLTYTVLTTGSNPAMSYIHNSKLRQPVIIPKKYEGDWLNDTLTEDDVLALCKSMPDDFLTYYSIGKQISGNKITSDEKNTPDIEKPVEYSKEEMDGGGGSKSKPETKPGQVDKSKPEQGQQSLF
ncbi:MAG TPA: SOS response-associated peptidase [Cyclobacteriaceae bacterium]|nr:SOS response-associated peptidase [Cyclobacteriaceae bacterium]